MNEAPKSNIVIHSKELPHNAANARKNFYETPEGKKCLSEGFEHQSNLSADANAINRQAHAENRGPTDAELGAFLDRMENKHSHRPKIKKVSNSSSTVSTFVIRDGKVVCLNDSKARAGLRPSTRIKPPWVK